MLTFYGSGVKGPIKVVEDPQAIPDTVDWIDALEPTEADLAFLRTALACRVPTREDLLEIETSSRLAAEDGGLIMSLFGTAMDDSGYPVTTPIGFVVTRQRVATIRFAQLSSFENLTRQICGKGEISKGGYGAVVTILEMIVDHIADLLERIGGDLDAMSRAIFQSDLFEGKDKAHDANARLKRMLQTIGRNGDFVSKISESMLGLSRMVPFMIGKAGEEITPDLKTRLEIVNQDVKSLHEHQEHITGKTQFLLDTVLGLANIEQNNTFRVLTVVSVVGIPPTLIASMYGMNFKTMPEYDWAHGYAYGLTLIFLSAAIPATWFKIKRWW